MADNLDLPKIPASEKPVSDDFEYAYVETVNKAFVRIAKERLKEILGANRYTNEEIDQKLSAIPKFNIKVVSSLPTTDISETTIYLVSSGDDSENLYTEYININGLWEILGTQKSTFSGSAKDVTYDDSETNLGADNVQDAVGKLSNIVDGFFEQTTEKVTLTDMISYLLKSGGNVVATSSTNENRIVSEPVYANEGEKYLFTCSANYGNALYVIYNMAGESIGQVVADATTEGNVLTEQEVIMPKGTYYFRLACNKDILVDGYSALKVVEKTNINISSSPLNGKKWVVVGDSVTEKNIRTSKNYHDYISDETGVEVINLGVGGTGYMAGYDETTPNRFMDRVINIPTSTDIITIFGSGNDRNLELGSVTDTDTTTVCGCINKTIDKIYQVAPTAWLGIITPTPWMNFPPYESDNKMAKYCQALVEICERRGIPCLDLYHCSGLRPWDETFRNLAYSKDDGDGTHPDETGHAMIYPQIRSFLLGGVGNSNAIAIGQLQQTVNDLSGGGNVKTILENIMIIMKAQVNLDGTPQAYSYDVSSIVSQTDTLISNLGTTDEPETEQPESGIVQTGSVLAITSGVIATQTGSVLAIA